MTGQLQLFKRPTSHLKTDRQTVSHTKPAKHQNNIWFNATALHRKPVSELRSVTCHMGSHSVTCHPTQVNPPHFYPSQTSRYSINQPRRNRRLKVVTLKFLRLHIPITYISITVQDDHLYIGNLKCLTSTQTMMCGQILNLRLLLETTTSGCNKF